MFRKLPKFGKIKMNGAWCDFHESNVITGTISDDYCRIRIEEFKPKMNKYKIIESNGGLLIDAAPDYQKFMESGIEIESYSEHEAVCSIYDNSLNTWRQCYVLDTDTLRLFLVYWYRDSMDRMTTTESFHSILEKPKAKNKYKIIPNQNKHPDSITYEFMNSYFTVESDSPVNAFRKYCEHDSFVLNLDSNFGYVFDTESLDLYYTSWSVNEQLGNSSFVKKLEKPFETDNDLNMKYKYKIISNRYNSTPSYDEMMKSDVLINATGPKTALSRYRHLFDSRVKSGWTLNLESLNLHQVIFDGQKEYVAHFIKKLEKSKMNTFKILITSKTPSLKVILESGTLVEAESAQDVYNKYCSNYSKFNIFRILNLSNLELTCYTYNQHKNCISFCVEKLEKPMTKPKLNTLSFKTLTEANNKRLPLFKNSKGLPAHSKPDGSDWSHAEWLQAVIGELGEYANIMKKVQRGDLTMEEAKPSIEKELADVMTYFAILAQQLNVDLGQAVEDKFNEVSERVKANVFIKNDVVYSKNEESIAEEKKIKNEKVRKAKDFMTSSKVKELMNQHKVRPDAWINNQDYATTTMIVGLAHMINSFLKKPVQKTITLQDLNNGKVYTRPFISGQDSTTLQEFSKLIVTDANVMKTLLNGKDYDGFNVNVGDMIQFSDDRNVLYSLRVTKIE
jgi:NTP pyrophosphatase (non-canonical NTP hydrolase)